MNCRLISYGHLREMSQEHYTNSNAAQNRKISLKVVKYIVSIFDPKAGDRLSLKTGKFHRDIVRAEKMTIDCHGKHTSIDYGRVLKEVKEYIGDDALWRQQEMKTYLSAEINRTIDHVCEKLKGVIDDEQKKDIFSEMSKYGIDIDPVCAQSSIKQVINNKIIQKGDYLARKMQQVNQTDNDINNQPNNEIKTLVVDKLSSRIFEDYFSISEAMVEDLKLRTYSLAVKVIQNNDILSASDKEMTKKVPS